MTDRAPERSFLVIAPVGRDGDLICGLLKGSSYPAVCVDTIGAASQTEVPSILGLIVTDEALGGTGVDDLRNVIHTQPSWSDLPVILLTSGPREPQYAAMATRLRLEIQSLVLLDRPVRKELLISAVQVAYTSRMQQLEIRDALARQSQSEEALRNSERLAATGRLAATMAHEVNNPLEAIGNLLYLIDLSPTLEEAKSAARLAAQELTRISEIVDRTLRYHRAPVQPLATDLSELASSALALFRAKMREQQIAEFFEGHPAVAFCVSGEIRQALVNLIGNAIDAMPEGGRLRVRVTSVTARGKTWARVTIGDTGSGIRKDLRSRLFTQFFTTKGSRGTGIGLWLTRDIVSRNGGRLRFRSRTGRSSGTVFSIYLPMTEQVVTPESSTAFITQLEPPQQEADSSAAPSMENEAEAA